MICLACEKEIPNNSKFCPECGEKLSSSTESSGIRDSVVRSSPGAGSTYAPVINFREKEQKRQQCPNCTYLISKENKPLPCMDCGEMICEHCEGFFREYPRKRGEKPLCNKCFDSYKKSLPREILRERKEREQGKTYRENNVEELKKRIIESEAEYSDLNSYVGLLEQYGVTAVEISAHELSTNFSKYDGQVVWVSGPISSSSEESWEGKALTLKESPGDELVFCLPDGRFGKFEPPNPFPSLRPNVTLSVGQIVTIQGKVHVGELTGEIRIIDSILVHTSKANDSFCGQCGGKLYGDESYCPVCGATIQ